MERDRSNVRLYESLINNAASDIASKSTGWHDRAYQSLADAASLNVINKDITPVRELMIKLLVDTSVRVEAAEYYSGLRHPVTAIGCDPRQRFVVVADSRGQPSRPVSRLAIGTCRFDRVL